jgi:outer membrane protein assembly factor BamB
MVSTAAEDGALRPKRTRGISVNFRREASIWDMPGASASGPALFDGKIYIGASNRYLYCLTADKGEVVWSHQARGPIWGTPPVVDLAVIWRQSRVDSHASAVDGKQISEIKIGTISINLRCWMDVSTSVRSTAIVLSRT